MGADLPQQRGRRPERLARAGIRNRLQVAGPSAHMEQPVAAPPAVRRLAVSFVPPCLVNSRLQRERPACQKMKVTFMSPCVSVPNQVKKNTRQDIFYISSLSSARFASFGWLYRGIACARAVQGRSQTACFFPSYVAASK